MRDQQGITAIGLIIILALIAFFTLIVLRLAPPYLEHFNVASSLASLQQEPGIKEKSPVEIKSLLQRRLDINDVAHVTKDDIAVEPNRKTGIVRITVAYEVRVPILANVDAVVSFSDSIEVGSR